MAKKRVYGEGSITQRKDGRWQISVPGADGKRRYAYADTPKEAEKVRRQLLAEVEQGKVPTSKQLFQDHVWEWLKMRERGGGKPNSFISVEYRLNAYFLPAFGRISLNKLTPGHIQKLYTKLLDRGLHPNTIRHYHATLKTCLDSAVKQGKIDNNPCSKVELPKQKKPKNNYLLQEEALRLLEVVSGHKLFSALVPLALATEARESELLALSWDDIDLERGVIRITKTLTKAKGGKRYILQTVPPKSESGIRDISLPGFALEVLRSYKVSQLKHTPASGKPNTMNLVFPTPGGGYHWPSNVSNQFTKLANDRGFAITFHDLRHTGATLLLEAGISPIVVQERLGHSDIKTTLGTYGHVTKRMKDQSANTLERLFPNGQKGNFEAI